MIKRGIVKLKEPIIDTKNGNRKIKEVEISELKAKHLKMLPDGTLEEGKASNPAHYLPLIASLCGLDLEIIEELSFVDLLRIVDVVVKQLGK